MGDTDHWQSDLMRTGEEGNGGGRVESRELEGQDETLLYDAGVVYRRSSACGVFELSRKASSKRINTASYLSGATQTYSATAAMVGRKASTRHYR